MTESSILVKKTADYVKRRLDKEKTGHDWFHVNRVWQIARFLQSKEGGDLEIIELAALLHSATEENYVKTTENENIRSLAMEGMLDILDIPEQLKQRIIHISHCTHYKGADSEKPADIEGQIVQDANWLDGLGAIGIARVFTAGGFLGRNIYDPSMQLRVSLTKEEFQKRKKEGTSIHYFLEKSVPSGEMLNTETAKKIAKKRLAFLDVYLNEFYKEWKLEDLNG